MGSQFDKAIDFGALRRSCGTCALRGLCLPANISGDQLHRLDALVRDKRPLSGGDTLFHAGATFSALYVVRSGSLMSATAGVDGSRQVVGFHLPGEMLGLDALNEGVHTCTTTALECSRVCELPYAALQNLAASIPELSHQFMRVISREAINDQAHLVMMGKRQALERLALFLKDLADRYHRLSRDPDCLSLPMSRDDLGSYLGLAEETVSRLMTRLQTAGILEVDRRRIRVIDRPGLDGLCQGHEAGEEYRHHAAH